MHEEVQASTGLLTTPKEKSRLTSSSIFHQRRSKRKAPKSGTHSPTSGPGLGQAGAAPAPETAPSTTANGRVPLSHPGLSNYLALTSQLSSEPHPHASTPHFSRHAQRRETSVPATPTKACDVQHGDGDHIPKVFLLPPLSLTSSPRLPSNAHVWSEVTSMDPNSPTQSPNLADLLTGLSSSEDASRKMAAFKLQSLINDPSFAEHFVLAGGLPRLRNLVLESTGNTLAYSLASFARLLEVDQGWEAVSDKVVEKVRLHWFLLVLEKEHN
jgi:hypothetical protein